MSDKTFDNADTAGANNTEDAKLEDILKSIRGIIDSHHSNTQAANTEAEELAEATNKKCEDSEKDNILELTSVVGEGGVDNSLVSEHVKKVVETEINKLTSALKDRDYFDKNQSLELLVNNFVRPLIKDWLDNNLPKIVEKLVAEEIKKITSK